MQPWLLAAPLTACRCKSTRCTAIRAFARCIGMYSHDMDATNTAMYQKAVLDAQVLHSDCEAGDAMAAMPVIQSTDGMSMDISVGTNGDVWFQRTARDEHSVFGMIEKLAMLEDGFSNVWDNLDAMVDAALDESRSDAALAFGSTIDGLQMQINAERQSREALEAALDGIRAGLSSEGNSLGGVASSVASSLSSTSDWFTQELRMQTRTATAFLNTQGAEISDSVEKLRAGVDDEVDRSGAAEAAIDEYLSAKEEEITGILDELEELAQGRPPVIWSGGCRHHSRGGGWDTYCFNGQDRADQFPRSLHAQHIEVVGGNSFRFLKAGYYNLNWWAIQHGCGSYNVDWDASWGGSRRNMVYAHRESKPGGWFSNFQEQTWAFQRNDQFWMTVHGGWCNPYRWHSWNENGDHSRMQVTYVGPLSD